MGRRYASHRRAWTPRFWPIAILTAAIVIGVQWLVALNVWESVALALLAGYGVGFARWRLWMWLHPIITPAQYVEDLRQAARWN